MEAHIFTNDLGEKTAVVSGQQIPVYRDDDPRLWRDILNWFENGQLCIGLKTDPDAIRRWRAWNKSLGIDV